MAGSAISVTEIAMQNIANDMAATSEGAKRQRNLVAQEWATLAPSWKSEASNRFGEGVTEWLNQMGKIIDALDQMVQYMIETRGITVNTHNASVQSAIDWSKGLVGV